MLGLNNFILLFFIKGIYLKLEDISKIFDFILANKAKKEYNSLIIDYDSTYIFPNNISIIQDLLINGTEKNILISTSLPESIILSTLNSSEEEYNCPKDYTKLDISNSQFNFHGCGPYNLLVQNSNNEFYHCFYQVFKTIKSNSIVEYNSILALSSLQNVSMVILDYINNNLKIIDDFSFESNEKDFNDSIKHMIKCDPIPSGEKFSCKIDYILFGMEGEKDDAFLAKKIEFEDEDDDEIHIAYFDNLSSYSIFPYEFLNYFLTSFFSKYNDGCKENSIKGTPLYYITCSRKKIEIYSYARNMSIIINYFSFPLKNLFNDSFQLLGESSPELIYFNILFNESSKDFIFGSNFFLGKQIGYNFLDNSTYIYSKDSIDFTSNFSGENSSLFQFLLYALTFGLFACLLILSAIMNWLHSRQVNKELANILKS